MLALPLKRPRPCCALLSAQSANFVVRGKCSVLAMMATGNVLSEDTATPIEDMHTAEPALGNVPPLAGKSMSAEERALQKTNAADLAPLRAAHARSQGGVMYGHH